MYFPTYPLLQYSDPHLEAGDVGELLLLRADRAGLLPGRDSRGRRVRRRGRRGRRGGSGLQFAAAERQREGRRGGRGGSMELTCVGRNRAG